MEEVRLYEEDEIGVKLPKGVNVYLVLLKSVLLRRI